MGPALTVQATARLICPERTAYEQRLIDEYKPHAATITTTPSVTSATVGMRHCKRCDVWAAAAATSCWSCEPLLFPEEVTCLPPPR